MYPLFYFDIYAYISLPLLGDQISLWKRLLHKTRSTFERGFTYRAMPPFSYFRRDERPIPLVDLLNGLADSIVPIDVSSGADLLSVISPSLLSDLDVIPDRNHFCESYSTFWRHHLSRLRLSIGESIQKPSVKPSSSTGGHRIVSGLLAITSTAGHDHSLRPLRGMAWNAVLLRSVAIAWWHMNVGPWSYWFVSSLMRRCHWRER